MPTDATTPSVPSRSDHREGRGHDHGIRRLVGAALGLTHDSYDPRLAVDLLVAAAGADRKRLAAAHSSLDPVDRLEDDLRQRARRLLELAAAGQRPSRPRSGDAASPSRADVAHLHPGSRLIRSVAHPHRYGLLDARGVWGCHRCGCRLPACESWTVMLADGGDGVPLVSMVCAGCAADLLPVRLVVDAGRLDEIDGAGRDHDETVREVARCVAKVRAERAAPGSREVSLRAADLHLLARRTGSGAAAVALRLHDLGVLKGLHCAAQVPVHHRASERTT